MHHLLATHKRLSEKLKHPKVTFIWRPTANNAIRKPKTRQMIWLYLLCFADIQVCLILTYREILSIPLAFSSMLI